MKYFFDTEFIEDGKTIDLISIGIVAQDGRTLYCESNECALSKANDWVKENVIPHLNGDVQSRFDIALQIKEFVGQAPEFWGWYADYDWVVLMQLYGTMMQLPETWPMYCNDLKQLCNMLGNPDLPKQKTTEHNALNDAIWTKEAYEYITSYYYGTRFV